MHFPKAHFKKGLPPKSPKPKHFMMIITEKVGTSKYIIKIVANYILLTNTVMYALFDELIFWVTSLLSQETLSPE